MAGLPIDRLAERRNDATWVAKAFSRANSHVLIVHRGRLLVTGEGGAAQLAGLAPERRTQSAPPVLLGQLEGTTYFAVSVTEDIAAELTAADGSRFCGLRSIVTHLEGHQAGLAAYARAVDLWHTNHQFCGRCGGATRTDQSGFRMQCTNADCGREHFPRLDPAVIVIVAHAGRCLLGRQPSWPVGRYSTLAGFVEPGESLEDAVRREVAEESNIRVGAVRYHSSQPWPFPSSLMVGFTADALTTEIRCDDELEDARWFAAEELCDLVHSGTVLLPFKNSVSYRLIADWMAKEHGMDIDTWPNKPL